MVAAPRVVVAAEQHQAALDTLALAAHPGPEAAVALTSPTADLAVAGQVIRAAAVVVVADSAAAVAAGTVAGIGAAAVAARALFPRGGSSSAAGSAAGVNGNATIIFSK